MRSSPQIEAAQASRHELAAELLQKSGTLVLSATGHSMVPTIWPGDTIVIERVASDRFVAGDIVLFSNRQRFVAHRVVARDHSAKNARILTRGDASETADAPVTVTDLLGKVSFIIRNGRCVEPGMNLRGSGRVLARLLSRSRIAARVVVGIHGLARKSQVPTI